MWFCTYVLCINLFFPSLCGEKPPAQHSPGWEQPSRAVPSTHGLCPASIPCLHVPKHTCVHEQAQEQVFTLHPGNWAAGMRGVTLASMHVLVPPAR